MCISFQSGDSSEWNHVCTKVISKPLLVWQEFLQPLFLDRVKVRVAWKGGFVHDYVEQQFQTNSLIDVVLNVIMYVSCIIYWQNT